MFLVPVYTTIAEETAVKEDSKTEKKISCGRKTAGGLRFTEDPPG